MKKLRIAMLLLISLSVIVGLFGQGTPLIVQMNPDTVLVPALSETTPIQDLIRDTAGQIINMVLFVLVSVLGVWLKNKFDIIIEMPYIRKQIRSAALSVEKYNMEPPAKINNIKTQLEKNLTSKQKTILGKVWNSVEDAIEDIFYDYVRPDRLYKLLKK